MPPLIWLVAGRWDTAVDVLFWLSLPIVVVLLLSVGEVMLITDGAMAGVAQEDYVLTARAKGLSEQQVRDRHAARVALLPALSKLMVSVPFFLSGLMIIELAFAQPRHIELALFV
ncbi:MAG: ABC transporter permease subunit, partial [Planctomycetes bacterium]|nr:ABC transporter permease subunit [Planctomycetota bacterium]